MLRYAITDRRLLSPQEFTQGAEGQARLLDLCTLLAREGVDFLQIREKDLEETELAGLGAAILAQLRCVQAHTRLLVNAHPSVALSIGADGVHLTSTSELTPMDVFKLFRDAGRPKPIASVSCHAIPDVERAMESGASLILFGPVFGKFVDGKEVTPALGLEALAEACRSAGDVPVLALGGVTEENAEECVAAGAAGIAGIRLFLRDVVV